MHVGDTEVALASGFHLVLPCSHLEGESLDG